MYGTAAGLMQANRQFHCWLTDGVPVEINRDGETLGERVKFLDFVNPDNNEWVAISQFTIEGAKHKRQPGTGCRSLNTPQSMRLTSGNP